MTCERAARENGVPDQLRRALVERLRIVAERDPFYALRLSCLVLTAQVNHHC